MYSLQLQYNYNRARYSNTDEFFRYLMSFCWNNYTLFLEKKVLGAQSCIMVAKQFYRVAYA